MKTAAKKLYIANRRGWFVAKTLGWPSRRPGLRGAADDLLDPFANFQRPRSVMVLVHQHQRQADRAVQKRFQHAAKQLTKTT